VIIVGASEGTSGDLHRSEKRGRVGVCPDHAGFGFRITEHDLEQTGANSKGR
jgi:hypothetical protein